MNDQHFMGLAIDVAKESESKGGCAIGTVIVKDGKVIAQGLSNPWAKRDPSNHAEIECIRNCSKDNDLMDMSGCTLYGTLEPCSMCLGASLWAGLDRLVFGAYAADVPNNNYEYASYDSKSLAKKSRKSADPNRGSIEVVGGVMREECKNLLEDYTDWQKSTA